jgi:hypothetical protein
MVNAPDLTRQQQPDKGLSSRRQTASASRALGGCRWAGRRTRRIDPSVNPRHPRRHCRSDNDRLSDDQTAGGSSTSFAERPREGRCRTTRQCRHGATTSALGPPNRSGRSRRAALGSRPPSDPGNADLAAQRSGSPSSRSSPKQPGCGSIRWPHVDPRDNQPINQRHSAQGFVASRHEPTAFTPPSPRSTRSI